MLLWSKLNPSRIVSQIAFELTFWDDLGMFDYGEYLGTMWAPSLEHNPKMPVMMKIPYFK